MPWPKLAGKSPAAPGAATSADRSEVGRHNNDSRDSPLANGCAREAVPLLHRPLCRRHKKKDLGCEEGQPRLSRHIPHNERSPPHTPKEAPTKERTSYHSALRRRRKRLSASRGARATRSKRRCAGCTWGPRWVNLGPDCRAEAPKPRDRGVRQSASTPEWPSSAASH